MRRPRCTARLLRGAASPSSAPRVYRRRALRAWLTAFVLAAISAASLLDGDAADFVGGDDGDAIVVTSFAATTFSAVHDARSQDLCAARRSPGYLTTGRCASVVRLAPAFRSAPSPAVLYDLSTANPLLSRAPPAR